MQRWTRVLVPWLVAPALVIAQEAPGRAKVDLPATFTVMNANVEKITAPSEQERWRANRDAWEVEVAQTGKVSPTDIGRMVAALDRIKANVERIRAGAEKQRWQANIDLWDLFLRRGGAFGRADLRSADAMLATMTSNVAEITKAEEKQRWQANRDLWQAMLDRIPPSR